MFIVRCVTAQVTNGHRLAGAMACLMRAVHALHGTHWKSPAHATWYCPRPRLRGLQRFRREIELFRHAREIEHRGGFHLAHDLASVGFHRDLTDTDVAGNLLVEPPLQHL